MNFCDHSTVVMVTFATLFNDYRVINASWVRFNYTLAMDIVLLKKCIGGFGSFVLCGTQIEIIPRFVVKSQGGKRL